MKTFLISIFLIMNIAVINAAVSENGLTLYNEIHDLYISWNDGLFGSKHFYKMLLNEKLYKSIHLEIKTADDYLWVSMDEEFRCVFMFSDWLVIHTVLNQEQYDLLHKKEKGYKTWYKTEDIYGIEGIIHNYSLDESPDKEKITLYLKNVRIVKFKKTGNDLP